MSPLITLLEPLKQECKGIAPPVRFHYNSKRRALISSSSKSTSTRSINSTGQYSINGRSSRNKLTTMCATMTTSGEQQQQQPPAMDQRRRRSILADYTIERAGPDSSSSGSSPDLEDQPNTTTHSRRKSHSETLQSLYKFHHQEDNNDGNKMEDASDQLHKALSTTEILLNLPMEGSSSECSVSIRRRRRRPHNSSNKSSSSASGMDCSSGRNRSSCSSRLRMSLQNVLAQHDEEQDKNVIASATATDTPPIRRSSTATIVETSSTTTDKGIQFELRRSGSASITTRRKLPQRQLSSNTRLRNSIAHLLSMDNSDGEEIHPDTLRSSCSLKKQKKNKRRSDSDLMAKLPATITQQSPSTSSLDSCTSTTASSTASTTTASKRYSRRARIAGEPNDEDVPALLPPPTKTPDPQEILGIFQPRPSLFRRTSSATCTTHPDGTTTTSAKQLQRTSSHGCHLIPLHKTRRMSQTKGLSNAVLKTEISKNLRRQSASPEVTLTQTQSGLDESRETPEVTTKVNSTEQYDDDDDDDHSTTSSCFPRRSWLDRSSITLEIPSIQDLGYGEAPEKEDELYGDVVKAPEKTPRKMGRARSGTALSSLVSNSNHNKGLETRSNHQRRKRASGNALSSLVSNNTQKGLETSSSNHLPRAKRSSQNDLFGMVQRRSSIRSLTPPKPLSNLVGQQKSNEAGLPRASRRGSSNRLSGLTVSEMALSQAQSSSNHHKKNAQWTSSLSTNMPTRRPSTIRSLQQPSETGGGAQNNSYSRRLSTTRLSGMSVADLALANAQQKPASNKGNAQWTSSRNKPTTENPFLLKRTSMSTMNMRSKSATSSSMMKRGPSSSSLTLSSHHHHRQPSRIYCLNNDDDNKKSSLRTNSLTRRSSLLLSGLSYSEMALSNAQHEMSSSSLCSTSSSRQTSRRSDSMGMSSSRRSSNDSNRKSRRSDSNRRSSNETIEESLESSCSSLLQGVLDRRLSAAQKSLLDNSLFDDSLLNDSILDESILGDSIIMEDSSKMDDSSVVDNRRRDNPSLVSLLNTPAAPPQQREANYLPYAHSLLDQLGDTIVTQPPHSHPKQHSPKPPKKPGVLGGNSEAVKQFVAEKKRGVSRRSSNGSLELLAMLSRCNV
ncbi:expressed unknown protein [Seminavis robusta]|uniref:Uncharacterized protein n=1 Tax=Seminavis robusta TaxID=568900 RepID=A0A9N8DTJ6_9STRA|nr:expressed unknown protein [Seminavis robusta]|eukprot:Sro360_g126230.1 n/a (1120) ;mRNA; f:33662-37021